VIFGRDGRLDYYEIPDDELLPSADATVALIPMRSVTRNDDGSYEISTRVFGEA